MFFREILTSLYDTRVPLARLFLWVQVIHAFDLPARKDATYSLVSRLILVSVGAILSTSLWYGLFVLAFLVCALGSLVQIQLSEAFGSPKRSCAAKKFKAPEIARLDEIYLYARFRDAVPIELAREFDQLEPEAFEKITNAPQPVQTRI